MARRKDLRVWEWWEETVCVVNCVLAAVWYLFFFFNGWWQVKESNMGRDKGNGIRICCRLDMNLLCLLEHQANKKKRDLNFLILNSGKTK